MDSFIYIFILVLVGYLVYRRFGADLPKRSSQEPPAYTHPKSWAVNVWDKSALLEALRSTEELIGQYRRLAESRPGSSLAYLADGLVNLGWLCHYLGRFQEALAPSREAVDIYRRMAGDEPGQVLFQCGLARSLRNLGDRLKDLDRCREALEPLEESTAILRRLVEGDSVFRPYLAGSLVSLGSLLYKGEKTEKGGGGPGRDLRAASALTEEALAIYRRLAEEEPATFRPQLAGCLYNLGKFYRGLGRDREALEACLESVAIGRELAESDALFQPELSMSLQGLALTYTKLNLSREAAEAAEEAVRIRRKLAEVSPDIFKPYLDGSLRLLAEILNEK